MTLSSIMISGYTEQSLVEWLIRNCRGITNKELDAIRLTFRATEKLARIDPTYLNLGGYKTTVKELIDG